MQFVRKAVVLLVLMITMSAAATSPAFANGGRGGVKPKPVFNIELCQGGVTKTVNLFNIFEVIRLLCGGATLGPCVGGGEEQ